MTIYIDDNCKCYTTPAEGRREIETDFFDGKCRRFIEGYLYVPEGETWTRSDGEIFHGTMITPWKDYALLEEFQQQYEEMLAEFSELQ